MFVFSASSQISHVRENVFCILVPLDLYTLC